MVSNVFPLHVVDEYPKNWTPNLVIQKIAYPSEILLPNVVVTISCAEVRQSSPVRKTKNKIK